MRMRAGEAYPHVEGRATLVIIRTEAVAAETPSDLAVRGASQSSLHGSRLLTLRSIKSVETLSVLVFVFFFHLHINLLYLR